MFKKKKSSPEDLADEMGDVPNPSESLSVEEELQNVKMQMSKLLEGQQDQAKNIRESVDINSVLDLLAEHINDSKDSMNSYYHIVFELSRRIK